MSPASLTLSMGPALHLPESCQEMQGRSWRALHHKWFPFNTTLSLFPEYLNALQNSTGVVTLLVHSSCWILESLVLHCCVLLLFPRTCLPTKGIYEQQSCINHLPSSTDYIQAFLFLCSFPVPLHSFSKCTRSSFVPLCPAASEKQTHTAPTSVPCMKNLLMREHLIPSLGKKKLNLKKQFSQLKLLRYSRAVLWKRTYFQQSPGTQAQLAVVFTVTSHSPATPACMKSGTLLTVLIQYSFRSSPCCSEQGNTKVFQWLTHNPRHG